MSRIGQEIAIPVTLLNISKARDLSSQCLQLCIVSEYTAAYILNQATFSYFILLQHTIQCKTIAKIGRQTGFIRYLLQIKTNGMYSWGKDERQRTNYM